MWLTNICRVLLYVDETEQENELPVLLYRTKSERLAHMTDHVLSTMTEKTQSSRRRAKWQVSTATFQK